MAEILGVVASAAGLLSLSIQILDISKKLKARFAAIKGLPEIIDKVERNQEFLSFFLSRVEEQRNHPTVAATDDYELMLNHCSADYNTIHDVLERLEPILEKRMAKRSSWRLQIRRNEAVVTEIQNLDRLERRAHQNITL